ncbi:hypothetical protein HCR_22930 (plasmid) [Hydrogenimonas cancrithermarum]|uniref:TonB-dependent receptor n=1 Tax=Hydrogenimonas cancrithermarum TaxID=2993563 RepID=A0ABM8FPN0_9BACT|nr:hypothetical protein HCR_22930 [Hydrogenimonas cancrithermarum]
MHFFAGGIHTIVFDYTFLKSDPDVVQRHDLPTGPSTEKPYEYDVNELVNTENSLGATYYYDFRDEYNGFQAGLYADFRKTSLRRGVCDAVCIRRDDEHSPLSRTEDRYGKG